VDRLNASHTVIVRVGDGTARPECDALALVLVALLWVGWERMNNE
jgi:hypothetical protein